MLAARVFGFTMAILLAPKLFGALALLADRGGRRDCGGTVRILASVLVETILGGLLAPVAMLLQTGAVLSILAGRDSGWNAQRRDDGALPLREVWRSYRLITALGVALAATAYAVSLPLMLWMLPVLIGLVLAVPLVAWTASRAAGARFRSAGLLLVPTERAPPPVLVRAAALRS